MTKRWIYALIVASIIVVGAVAGPVMAAAQGTGGVSAPATAVLGPDAGTNGAAGAISSSSVTPPNFEWLIYTYPSDTAPTLVYTVPSGYKLKIDDVTIGFYGATGYTTTNMLRGVGGNTIFSVIPLTPFGHFEHSYQNLVLNGGESLKVRTGYGSGVTYWTITAHWV